MFVFVNKTQLVEILHIKCRDWVHSFIHFGDEILVIRLVDKRNIHVCNLQNKNEIKKL
jgi:hypothetical protein